MQKNIRSKSSSQAGARRDLAAEGKGPHGRPYYFQSPFGRPRQLLKFQTEGVHNLPAKLAKK